MTVDEFEKLCLEGAAEDLEIKARESQMPNVLGQVCWLATAETQMQLNKLKEDINEIQLHCVYGEGYDTSKALNELKQKILNYNKVTLANCGTVLKLIELIVAKQEV